MFSVREKGVKDSFDSGLSNLKDKLAVHWNGMAIDVGSSEKDMEFNMNMLSLRS